ncbi:MAG: GH39 family glycosyl hydrolase [Armatimonadota bacterium]
MAEIRVDFSKPIGQIKPVHGVNNGPVCYGSILNVSASWRELGIPFARLHDPNWPHPREVDIPQIFPDFSKDPHDPASYDFRQTDDYIQSILDAGTSIFYRLGVSIEHTKRKIYTAPPADFEKWAQICVGIIRHYNDGWADGFQHGIKYWEIWNEPDNPDGHCMWSGTPEQYYQLYAAASRAIKAYDPSLMVGGFAATSINPEFTNGFLAFCRAEGLSLDFYSWHVYANEIGQVTKLALEAQELLTQYGYEKAESWLNEWNYVPEGLGALFDPNSPRTAVRKAIEGLRSAEAASFVTSVLLKMQDLPIDHSCYYDGQPGAWYCGLWDTYGVPMKPYYGFKAFRALVDCGTRVRVEHSGGVDGVYSCAAISADGQSGCLLVCNPSAEAKECQIYMTGLPEGAVEQTLLVDNTHELEPVDGLIGLPAHSIQLHRWG